MLFFIFFICLILICFWEFYGVVERNANFCQVSILHNCMATTDRAVVVFVKELQWDQKPQPLQDGLIHHSPQIYYVFTQVITKVKTQLFPIDLPLVRLTTWGVRY